MEHVWRHGRENWARREIVKLMKESRGRTRGDVDEIIVPELAGLTVAYKDEGEWCDEECEDDDYRYELDHALQGACYRFNVRTTIPSRIDAFIC